MDGLLTVETLPLVYAGAMLGGCGGRFILGIL